MNIKMWLIIRLYLLADRLNESLRQNDQATIYFKRISTPEKVARLQALAGLADDRFQTRFGNVEEKKRKETRQYMLAELEEALQKDKI